MGVLWAAGKPQRFTLAAVPKGTVFVVEKSSADGTGGGIVTTDVIKHGGVLDVFRERDGMFTALPLQNDVFGELHDTRRVSPCAVIIMRPRHLSPRDLRFIASPKVKPLTCGVWGRSRRPSEAIFSLKMTNYRLSV